MKQLLLSIALIFLADLAVAEENVPLNQRPARQAADWIQNGVMYQINARAFTPEGTIHAAKAKLPLLKEAGITIVYFWPLFEMDDDMRLEFWSPRQVVSKLNNPKNPYRMNDYEKIDPEYGTEQDAKEFIDEAHKLGMRVMFDLVFLHCGPNAKLVKTHPEYFRKNPDGSMHLTVWKFPEFDFTKSEVREYFWANMEYWVRELGCDGYRMDVADGIPLDFWEEARRRMDKIRTDVCFFAEGQRVQDQLLAFDLNYGFSFWGTLKYLYDKDGKGQNWLASDVRKICERMKNERPIGARIVHYLDNHDLSNDDFYNRLDKRWGVDGVNASLALIYTLDGVPMLYCGQEIADNSRHSLYGSKTFGNCIIDWAKLNTDEGQARFKLVRALSDLRRSNKAFTEGSIQFVDNDKPRSVVSFEREFDGKKALVVINLSKDQQVVKVESSIQGTPNLRYGAALSNEGVWTLQRYGWTIICP